LLQPVPRGGSRHSVLSLPRGSIERAGGAGGDPCTEERTGAAEGVDAGVEATDAAGALVGVGGARDEAWEAADGAPATDAIAGSAKRGADAVAVSAPASGACVVEVCGSGGGVEMPAVSAADTEGLAGPPRKTTAPTPTAAATARRPPPRSHWRATLWRAPTRSVDDPFSELAAGLCVPEGERPLATVAA
jgi:hypothetical protein